MNVKIQKNLIALLFALASIAPNANAINESQKDRIAKRAIALQEILTLSAEQTDSIRTILLQTSELGESNKEKYNDDYYALAIENQKATDSMRARVNSTLTEKQRKKYQTLQNNAEMRYSSKGAEVLSRRINLNSSQTKLTDAILSYAESDIKKIRQKTGIKRMNSGSGNMRGPAIRSRAKMLKALEAIEKTLDKAQLKEFKVYKQEKLDELRPSGAPRPRGGRR